MKTLRPFLVVLAAVVGLGLGLSSLYRLRLAKDLFPPYSTLRADPLGLRALHDTLAASPGIEVSRWVKPVDKLPAHPPRTLVLAGGWADQFEDVEAEEFAALDAAVRGGSRLVIVFRAESAEHIADREEFERMKREFREARERGAGRKPKQEPADEPKKKSERELAEERENRRAARRVGRDRTDAEPVPAAAPNAKPPVDLTKLWGFTVKYRVAKPTEDPPAPVAQRAPDAARDLPAEVKWRSARYLALNAGQGWRTLYRRAGEPVLAEMTLGQGSVVVGTDSYFLSNEAVQRDRATTLLLWTIGDRPRVTFVETHLGVQENTGVAALARRYGLAPAAGLALLLALLFVWRRAALFVPPAPEPEEAGIDYHPTAGLAALLRRALPLKQLLQAGFADWKKSAPRGDVVRAEAVAPAPGDEPVAAYNRVVAALRRR